MMSINTYFKDFLQDIRLTQKQKDDSKNGHRILRERLSADENLKSIIVSTFLQGSYRRATAVRPHGEKRADVDVIVVTNLDKSKVTPEKALELFEVFAEKYYKGKWKKQGRSIGISMSYVDLDIVVTSAPSETAQKMMKSMSVTSDLSLEETYSTDFDWRLSNSWSEPDLIKGYTYNLNEAKAEAEWKTEPLYIPDRDAGTWEKTDPLEQIRWTREKNKTTNTHYVNVVKALKWWKSVRMTDLKYPKGYPVEHMIGDCCPDDIQSVGEGVLLTLENFVSNYSNEYMLGSVPRFPDRGVPEHDVWHRITYDDFKKFYDGAKKYAKIAREAYEADTLKKSVDKWIEVFGDKFPPAPDDNSKGSSGGPGGFTPRTSTSDPGEGRFA
jgi:hypothetical protein